MAEIPQSLEDIDRNWLQDALQVPVRDVRVLDAHDGTTGRGLLQLDYVESSTLPPRLFVKLPPGDELQRAFVTSSGMGRREALFYRHLSQELPVRVPRAYYADTDESGEAYVMLLENLVDSGCTFDNARRSYSLQYLRDVLSAFASYHAAFWKSPRFATDLSWIEGPIQHEIALQLIESSLSQFATEMPPVFTQMGEMYLENFDAIHALWRRGDDTLLHGDVHDANLFMDAGTPGFLDWAIVSRGPAMRDVGYFLAGTVEPGDRRGLRPLLEFYRRELEARDVAAPHFDVLWQQMQWHAAYVWVGAAVSLAMGDAWQPVNYLLSSLRKLHGTLEYLDTVESLQRALAQ